MKKCSTCKLNKEDTQFGYNPYTCLQCRREYYQKTKNTVAKNYSLKNKEKIAAKQKQYYYNNLDRFADYRKSNKEKHSEYMKQYRLLKREDIVLYKKNYENTKYKNDPSYRLRKLVSGSVYTALEKISSSKENKSCSKYLPFNFDELKDHIEKQFQEPGNEWMNWNNQGQYNPDSWDDNNQLTWTWNLDHIVPQSFFKFNSMEDEEFKKCWALSNLRPYPSKHNVTEKNNR